MDEPRPAFRYAVGWNPVRIAGVTLDSFEQYERRLLDYLGLDRLTAGRVEREPR